MTGSLDQPVSLEQPGALDSNAGLDPNRDAQADMLLALHSSSETLGVAVCDCRDPIASQRSATFPLGRGLSNSLLSCVEELYPAALWPQLSRLAVAIGPGGFTGTRLTVVMARTLAQQLSCPLDGFSSYQLMAPRLAAALSPEQLEQPFWIVKTLPRRGIVAGRYQQQPAAVTGPRQLFVELVAPHLLAENHQVSPALEAEDDVAVDVVRLLELSSAANKSGQDAPWPEVLPIYPTSPVGVV